ncbi:MAG: dCTP deaminase [Patescibacteria group bacterium]
MAIMALSDKTILEQLERGDIVIEPFKRENLATSSYDVSLGEMYFREQKSKNFSTVYNIYNQSHTEKVWGTEPIRATRASDILNLSPKDMEGIGADDLVIILEPGETVLAHTDEFIGGRNHITTMMKARSSLGRNFIEVCKCAGWGDVGYTNRWTMEVTNNSRHYSIPLVVGRRIAQIIFFETGPILESDYTKAGKYQSGESLADLKAAWRPESMLPKLYNDREARR